MTNSYFFANAEPIDLSAIEIMGVNVKSGKSPIGFFGTGLKFAIATLLRNGQEVRLRRAGPNGPQVIDFVIEPELIRGQEFGRVVMVVKEPGPADGLRVKLGFTTALGRNWQLWQAFRELESNCRDEGGVSGPTTPTGWGTVFEIRGEAFSEVARDKDKIFLATLPKYTNSLVEVHPLGANPKALYFRGVLAGELEEPGAFTYNVLDGELTEDRTLANRWVVNYWAPLVLSQHGNEADLERVLLAPAGQYERIWNNWYGTPSEAFSEVVKRNRFHPALNQSAFEHWLGLAENRLTVWEKVEIDEVMAGVLREALPIARRMGARIGVEDFEVVTGIGGGAYGCAYRWKIYISPSAFDMGPRFLASTLFEEWLHVKEGMVDESRRLQGYLFERLAVMTERVMELESGHAQRPGEVIRLAISPAAQQALEDAPTPMPRPSAKRWPDDDIPF